MITKPATRLIDRLSRRLELPADPDAALRTLLDTEWIVTNGLGGYSSTSLSGVITRRYHGILVAALPNPLGRMVMLNHLGARIVCDGRASPLNGAAEVGGPLDRSTADRLQEIRLDAGLPVWVIQCGNARVEKRILMPHGQNSVHVTHTMIEGPDRVTLELTPAVHFRGYEDRVDTPSQAPATTRYVMTASGGLHVLSAASAQDLPPLRLTVVGGEWRFLSDERITNEFIYPVEESRGYDFRGTLWSPGHFEITLERNKPVTLVASTESVEVMLALTPDDVRQCEHDRRRRLIASAVPAAQDEMGAELVVAADQFVITPVGRVADATRATAMGDEIRTVIAGYHWFTDWGRDTMISLEGLTLVTGRAREANFIVRTFAHYVRDGLIPNMFPDGSNQGLYHTADATLWFFHAVGRYVQWTGDTGTLQLLLPVFVDIVKHHQAGTRFGICMDPADGLLRQGAEGYQLTWMDAKVDDWVVTPRRGKAVEINALWYNALRLLQRWLADIRGEDSATEMAALADRVYESFNRRFWIADRGYLYDVVDGEHGDSTECRPNQIFAISLDNPVLEPGRWTQVLHVVEQRLLTPVGLRSLAPGERDYKDRYYGDLRARDAAYHQGTVWAWLIGPWIDAWLRVHPEDPAAARRFLDGLIVALGQFGLGTIGEIFDGDEPYTPRGCIAQAWSVAETLRGWVRTARGQEEGGRG